LEQGEFVGFELHFINVISSRWRDIKSLDGSFGIDLKRSQSSMPLVSNAKTDEKLQGLESLELISTMERKMTDTEHWADGCLFERILADSQSLGSHYRHILWS
jgi:hypothetical protein